MLAAIPLCAILPGRAEAASFDHEHRPWTALLGRHVRLVDGGKASRVDYAGIQRDRAALQAYLDALARVRRGEFDAWSRLQRMAFLVNAYNARTVEKVLTRYPDLDSIRDFGTIFGNPFKDRFFRLFGEPASLDVIEQDLLRRPGAYDEPRVHFALNCASIGCPMLREEAYTGARLAAQLEEQTRRFLSDRTRNRYDPGSGRLEISRLFDWYAEDFTRGYRGVTGDSAPVVSRERFLGRHADLLADGEPGRARVRAGEAPLDFLEYDWRLNAVAR